MNIFLISLKAGGCGLNLTAAQQVFMLDPWWNPAIEQQAIDRVHRLGQSEEVKVFRFIMKDTIEEQIRELQDQKRKLADGALGGDMSQLSSLRIKDLRLLFRV